MVTVIEHRWSPDIGPASTLQQQPEPASSLTRDRLHRVTASAVAMSALPRRAEVVSVAGDVRYPGFCRQLYWSRPSANLAVGV